MDIIVAMNLVFCILIVGLGYWGYRQSRKISQVLYLLPIFISIAFGLFGISHFVNLIGMGGTFVDALIVIRAFGYIVVIFTLAWVINSSIKLYHQHVDKKNP
jgi:ABC-type uncharacterized transport system YnjBCD permease subunit